MIEITLFLYGKPQWELHGKQLTPATLRNHTKQLQKRLQRVYTIAQRLHAAGWKIFLDTYSLVFYHTDLTTLTETKHHLRQQGIYLKPTELHYWKEEELASL